MNYLIKNSSKVKYIALCGLFLIHFFTIERFKNNFLEYDHHYFVFLLNVIILFSLIFRSSTVRSASFNGIDISLLLVVVLISLQLWLFPLMKKSIVIDLWLLLFIYYLFKEGVGNCIDTFISFFVGSNFLILIYYLSEKQLFNSEIFVPGTSGINSGVNAAYLATVGPFLLSMVFRCNETKHTGGILLKYASLISFFLCLFIIIQSKSRTAWLATAIGTFYIINCRFAILKIIERFFKGFLFRTILIVGMLFALFYLYQYKVNSANGRLLIYRVSFDLLSSNKWLGTGLGRFEALYNNYQSIYFKTHNVPFSVQLLADNTFYAFNEFLQLAIELGIVGFISVGLALFYIFKKIEYKISKNYVLAGANSSLLSIVICCMTSYPLHILSISVYCAFYLAIISFYSKSPLNLRSLNTILVKGILIGLAPAFLCIGYFEYKRMVSLREWERAAYLSLVGNFSKAKNHYQKAITELNDEGQFLFNYGAHLSVAQEYGNSIKVLEMGKKVYSHNNLYLYLGNNYRMTSDVRSAEECYNISRYMVPSKFLPKFELLQLYLQINHRDDVTRLAKEIIEFPVKVPSKEIEEIKQYAKDVINYNDQKPHY